MNESIGHGVVATRDIPKGTITWVQDELDREFSPGEIRRLGKPFAASLDKYCFRNQHGRWVLCWDHARFVNHSFKSNCVTTAYNFEIAVRDIRAGEELTDDYGYLNIMRLLKRSTRASDGPWSIRTTWSATTHTGTTSFERFGRGSLGCPSRSAPCLLRRFGSECGGWLRARKRWLRFWSVTTELDGAGQSGSSRHGLERAPGAQADAAGAEGWEAGGWDEAGFDGGCEGVKPSGVPGSERSADHARFWGRRLLVRRAR
ncbi:MAG: SET domain-containing protein [Phycisphaerales bacterium]